MGLLKKAQAKSETAPKAKAKGVAWLVGDNEAVEVGKSVHELVRLAADVKAAEAKMELHKNNVKRFANERFVQSYADSGLAPESPMAVQNMDGEKVTFVAQDRSSQYKVTEEQENALVNLLGADLTNDILYEQVTFSFNREIMAIAGVTEAVDEALEKLVQKLKSKGVLSDTQADSLIDADSKKTFVPGMLQRITQLVGRDTSRIRKLLDIMGSCCTRYVKT